MAKKLTQEENIHDLTDRSKVSKAKKVLTEHKSRIKQPKKWVKSQTYFKDKPNIYVEVPTGLSEKEIIERIEKLLVR
ncbi:hypothetical protein CCP3SC1AL1_1620013 [Gammaproteobacteria bacterium]